MFDKSIRSVLIPKLEIPAKRMVAAGISANQLTGAGFVIGVGCCVAVAFGQWWLGLVLWVVNRLVDGFDGIVARLTTPTELGGYYDIMADFAIYFGVVVAIGVSEPDARVAALVTGLAYYLSGSSFLAWSSLAERLRLGGNDGRSLNFPTAIAEGTETIAAMILVLALRDWAAVILWIWAGAVFVSVAQRMVWVRNRLGDPGDQPSSA